MKVKFYIACLLLAVLCYNAEAKTYLVSVGVSDYPGTSHDLNLPVSDAKTIQYVYSKNSNAESVLVTNSDATRNNVLAKMRSTFSKANDNDIIVLFFSGHGSSVGAFCAYDGDIQYSEIRQIMAASKAKTKIIFADACFAGKMRQGRKNSNNQSFNKFNIMLFLSSRSNETSLERRNMKNGIFTTCLQKALRGGADANRDRKITAKELFLYVSKYVKQLSNDRQHPVMWGKFDDNMVIMKW